MSAISIPGYEVIDAIGRGGFGVVYRARQVTGDREVAVKVGTRVPGDGERRRFLDEVRAAGPLSDHPHVVESYDAGVLPDGRPYLVMELCPGGSLAGRGPMPPREVAEIGQQLADVLATAHDLGVRHGDVTPGNVLVKPHGTVGLAGFGLAAVESDLGARSDVQALSATLYTLVAGFPPGDDVQDLPVSPEFMAILRRGLATDPAPGYPAADLRADLSQLVVAGLTGPRHRATSSAGAGDESGGSARPGPGRAPADAPKPGRRVLVAVVWLAALALVAALLIILM